MKNAASTLSTTMIIAMIALLLSIQLSSVDLLTAFKQLSGEVIMSVFGGPFKQG